MTREYLTSPRPPGPGPVRSVIILVASGVAGLVLLMTEVVLRFLIGVALGILIILLVTRLFSGGESRHR